jgi:hypothetical protein
MEGLKPPVKMVGVDGDLVESVGFVDATHTMYINFRNSPPMIFEKVPRFRYQGLLNAPRKDAYYKTFIQNQFLSKPAPTSS